MPFRILETVPILRIFDEAKAREFYVEYLGFQCDWTHRFEEGLPLYMQVSRGGCLLHLSEHHGDACPGSTVFLRISGIDDLLQELRAKNYKPLRPCIEPFGDDARTMELLDPFGNRLRFWEDRS